MQIYKGVAGIQCRVAPATPGDPLALPPPQPGYQSGRGGSVPEGTDPDKIRLEQSYRQGAQDQGRVRDSGPLSVRISNV